MYITEQEVNPQFYSSFLAQYKGFEEISDNNTDTEPDANQFIALNIEESLYTLYNNYLTELGEIDSIQTVSILNNQSAYHTFTGDDIFKLSTLDEQTLIFSIFTFDKYYSLYKFHKIILDSEAAGISSARESQILALQRRDSSI